MSMLKIDTSTESKTLFDLLKPKSYLSRLEDIACHTT